MKRHLIAATLLLLPFGALYATGAQAEVNLNIGINLPTTGVVVSSSPDVVVISGTYVYFVPDAREDVFFYHGYWYRPHNGGWYRSTEYNRDWVVVSFNSVPPPVRAVPPGFRRVPPGHEKIPYGQLKKNWKSWEKERRWERVSEARERHEGHGDHGHKKHNKGRGRGED